jgi:hypothetical protein
LRKASLARRRPSLWFVTPAHRRFDLTRICLEQRRWACDELGKRYGIDASCVVIACDDNLTTAHQLGFHAVERDNRYLGRRFNDGYRAAACAGVDYVFAIGSDAWIDPAYFKKLPAEDELRVSRYYTLYPPAGDRRGEMRISDRIGVAFTWPLALLADVNYRPCEEWLKRGCDTSSFNNRPERTRLTRRRGHQFELVSFQSAVNQLSSYTRLMARWGSREVTVAPFRALRDIYPARLVRAVQAYYKAGTNEAVDWDEEQQSFNLGYCGDRKDPRPDSDYTAPISLAVGQRFN